VLSTCSRFRTSTASTSFAFRTLAGAQTIDVRPSETREAALARHFGVDARRIVLQQLDGESCVSVLDPFEIHHMRWSPEYRCPPGFMELYRQNLDSVSWSLLSGNPGAFELLAANLDKVNCAYLSTNEGALDILAAHPDKIDWKYLSRNLHSRAIDLLAANPWCHVAKQCSSG
jgi:hypothetical protein